MRLPSLAYYSYVFYQKKVIVLNWLKQILRVYEYGSDDIIDNNVIINEIPEKVTLIVDVVNVNSTIANKDIPSIAQNIAHLETASQNAIALQFSLN